MPLIRKLCLKTMNIPTWYAVCMNTVTMKFGWKPLKNCERIGHSLGLADYSVLDAINKDAEVVCFYHSETEDMEKTLKDLGLHYVMKPNTTIYR